MSDPMKETKEFLSFLNSIFEGVDISLKDGQINYRDAFNFTEAMTKAAPGIVGVQEIVDLKLTSENKAELVQFNQNDLDLSNDLAEKLGEKGFELFLSFAEYYQLWKSAKEKKDQPSA